MIIYELRLWNTVYFGDQISFYRLDLKPRQSSFLKFSIIRSNIYIYIYILLILYNVKRIYNSNLKSFLLLTNHYRVIEIYNFFSGKIDSRKGKSKKFKINSYQKQIKSLLSLTVLKLFQIFLLTTFWNHLDFFKFFVRIIHILFGCTQNYSRLIFFSFFESCKKTFTFDITC